MAAPPDERVEAAVTQVASFLDEKRNWMVRRDKRTDELQRNQRGKESPIVGQYLGVYHYRHYLKRIAMDFNWDEEDGPAEALVNEALRGDVDADVVLRELAISYLAAGDILPGELRSYVIAVLARGSFPTAKKGLPAAANFARDHLLAAAVAIAIDFGFSPTRNPASENISGCDIVSRALTKADLPFLDWPGIEKIWIRLGSRVPRVGSKSR